MQCSSCKKQDHTVFHSSVYDRLLCTQCYEEMADTHLNKLLYKILAAIVIIVVLFIASLILGRNEAQGQVLGTPCPCDSMKNIQTYWYDVQVETRPIRWELKVQEYLIVDTYTERAWSFYLYWVPVYESRWRESK